MSDPLISVITPFLNAGPFLSQAIESVVHQTYSNWELILIDDGSGDESSGIAREYTASMPEKIATIEHPGHANRGLPASRNAGLAASNGPLIAFLDADDLFLPTRLETQMRMLARHPEAAMAVGNVLFWHEAATPDLARAPDYVPEPISSSERVYEPPQLLTRLLQREELHPAICSVLVRRTLMKRTGGFDERFDLYEDAVWLARAWALARAVVNADCCSVYRVHANSMCQRAAAEGHYDPSLPNEPHRRFLEAVSDHLASDDIDDPTLSRALQRAMRPYRHPRRYALAGTAGRVVGGVRAAITSIRGSQSDRP